MKVHRLIDPGTMYNWKDTCLLFYNSKVHYKEGENVPKLWLQTLPKNWVIGQREWDKQEF